MSRRALIALLAVTVAVSGCGAGGASSVGNSATAARTGVRLVLVGHFHDPVGVIGVPGAPDRVAVIQKTGQVILVSNGLVQSRPFLDVSRLITTQGEEQGLLGLAFSPGYANDGLFYVNYTAPSNQITIVQYRRSAGNPNVADPLSGRVVLRIDHHQFQNHNGGDLAFGPDGDLYIGVGDGGSEGDPHGNGQNTDTLLGKLLRIDPSPGGGYRIPNTNPFVGQPGKRPEIWAYGLRNPWRFSFDRLTGDLVIADVGGSVEEEIDFAPAGTGAGANYGWAIWEGNRRNETGTAPNAVFPVVTALHSAGYCAIVGGYVVRDRSIPSLYGRYLFGDFCRAQIESVKLNRGHAQDLRATGLTVSATSAFGEDASGHIYIASLDGSVLGLADG
jgi:glucose/arabinose dehydrogenase